MGDMSPDMALNLLHKMFDELLEMYYTEASGLIWEYCIDDIGHELSELERGCELKKRRANYLFSQIAKADGIHA